jgi:GDP-4-dehydro-6-deoxy-D-mannose reductase
MAGRIKSVLITGAQGFLGRHLVWRMMTDDQDLEVIGIGRSQQSHTFTHDVHWGSRRVRAPLPHYLEEACLPSRYRYFSIDLANGPTLTELLRDIHPEVVVHLASGLYGADPHLLFRTNVEGTISLLRALGEAEIPLTMFIFGSTGGVYGSIRPQALPIDEGTPCCPLDLYAVSKLSAEHVTRVLGDRYSIPVVVARIFNLVGPGLQEQHVCARLAAQCAAISERAMPARLTVGELDTTRDLIDVRDAAAALATLATDAAPGTVYNVGNGREVRVRDILTTLLQLSGLEETIRIERLRRAPSPVRRHCAAVERLRKLGFNAEHNVTASLRDLLDYYRHDVARLAG